MHPGVEPGYSAWVKISPPKREAITGVNAFDFGGVGKLGQIFDLPKRPSKAMSREAITIGFDADDGFLGRTRGHDIA